MLSKAAVEMIVEDFARVRDALVAEALTPEAIATLVLAGHAAQLHEALTAIGNDVDKAARMLNSMDDQLAGMNRRER